MQHEIVRSGPLLDAAGNLAEPGWSRSALLDGNLEQAAFYPSLLRPLQRLRIKRWDYTAVFSPRRFFSATIADLGYAGNLFVYTLDWASGALHEEGLVVPLSRGVVLPRGSDAGRSEFVDKRLRLLFDVDGEQRRISVDWPAFHDGRGIAAEITLHCPARHESMVIATPIGRKRFYYNRKTNCMPAAGWIRYGEEREELSPQTTLGSLDWGRGVWEYRSFWNWGSASGFLPDGRTVGLNLGCGFGDTSAATENCLILDGRVHKLADVPFAYDSTDYMKDWRFVSSDGRLDVTLIPSVERVARTNLLVITSEVHQMFGHYHGTVVTDDGETIRLQGLTGFAEEHHARW